MSQPAHRTLHRCSETTKIAGAIAWAVGSSKTSTLALGSQISRIIISVQQPGALACQLARILPSTASESSLAAYKALCRTSRIKTEAVSPLLPAA